MWLVACYNVACCKSHRFSLCCIPHICGILQVTGVLCSCWPSWMTWEVNCISWYKKSVHINICFVLIAECAQDHVMLSGNRRDMIFYSYHACFSCGSCWLVKHSYWNWTTTCKHNSAASFIFCCMLSMLFCCLLWINSFIS
jgi:hypothetical protein